MLFLSSLLLAVVLQHPVHDTTYADSIRGTLVTRVMTRGTFVMFDEHHPDRFFLNDASDGMTSDFVMTQPETDLFLADHAKDKIQISYEVRNLPKPGGGTERLNYETKLRSLRTGDVMPGWTKKLAADSDLLARCKKELRELGRY